MHLCAAKWINEKLMEFLFLSFIHLFPLPSATCSRLRPWIPLPQLEGLGEMGWDRSPLFKRGHSQSASCIIMRNDVSIHTKLFLSPGLLLPARRNTFVLSARRYVSHTPPSLSRFYPKTSTQYLLFFPSPSLLSTLEYPVFHSAAHWGCVNVPRQLCNIISWVAASRSLPLRNLPATVHQSLRVLSLPFRGTNMIPLMETTLSLVLIVRLPPPSHSLTQVKPFHLAAEWPVA